MKIICNTTDLSVVCQNVQRATAKTMAPALEGILLKAEQDEITVTGYNLEMGIITKINADVIEPGEIVLNSRVLCEILKKLPKDEVKITTNKTNNCKISCGDVKYDFKGFGVEEYPTLPVFDCENQISIESEKIKNMLIHTITFVALTDTKIVHTGLKFEIKNGTITIIALDGFRMAIRTEKIKTDLECSFIVPGKTLSEVIKLINNDEFVLLELGKKHIAFKIGIYEIISRLLTGEFLDYEKAMPKETRTKAIVNIKETIDSIERTSLVINDKAKSPIKCELSNGKVIFSAQSAVGTAIDSVNADITGEDLSIGFNNKFLLDALKACGVENVTINFNGSLSPVTMQSDNFIYLVLPVRLKNE